MKRQINSDWRFTKEAALISETFYPLQPECWETVQLPHTWNGKDGQDGGNDYYRGTCYYTRTLARQDLPEAEEIWLEFEAANASADVYVNGMHAGHHDGGYSLFRVNVTSLLTDRNTLLVAVDNSVNDRVYPQMADFTFYGGLYRNVNVIGVPSAHFALEPFGTPGLIVTPEVRGDYAIVHIQPLPEGTKGTEQIVAEILDGDAVVARQETISAEPDIHLTIENVHLWDGVRDPHLYTCRVTLLEGERVLDERTLRFGCRTYRIDPEKGFFLNGRSYPLRGVCRHQDRPGIGNALLPEHHQEDMDLICELGANTIRLAHYQHSQTFYDLCDERGMVVWAEIPYISRHMPGGRENTIRQMTELITQNRHHASIVVWGLSNEVTMRIPDANDPNMVENHRILSELVHQMDPERLTTLAAVGNCPMDAEYLKIPDVLSYNLYFGWYTGSTEMNGPFLDRFHAQYPDRPVGMSEYGCEGLNWHSAEPVCGDYTEEYQAHYHEELIRQLYTRPYLWATHVWNMFDFAADARSEGGCNGMNNKGLVTFDRSYRKDAFYAHKAWLSPDPFVHICGKRFVNHAEPVVNVTVYSNLPSVELLANGRSLGVQSREDHFFTYEVPNVGETTLVARAGQCVDETRIVRVAEPDPTYQMRENGDVLDWFEIESPEGFCSIRDKIGVLLNSEEAAPVVRDCLRQHLGKPMDSDEEILKEFAQMPLRRVLGLGWAKKTTRNEMLEMNRRLNGCRR